MNMSISSWIKRWTKGGLISRQLFRLLILSLTIVVISACGGAAINNSNSLTPASSLADCHMVQHEMGEVSVPNEQQRVVTILFSFVGNTLTLDVKPIGSTLPFDNSTGLTEPYISTETYLGDSVEGIHNVGQTHTPSLEKLLQLKPDLILAWNRSSATQIYTRLSEIAPTVLVPYQFANHWNHFDFIAEVLGREDAAQQAKDLYYQRIEELKLALGNRYQNKQISVISSYSKGTIAYGQNSFVGSIFDDIGLKRPAAQDVRDESIAPGGAIRDISNESLEVLDGDILFCLTFGKDSTKAFQELQRKPLWRELKAVQEGRVYFVSGETWIGANLIAADAVLDDLYEYLVNTSQPQ